MPGKPEEEKGFAELWQPLTTKLLTGDQARKGKLDRKRISRWEPTVEGYIRFLRDNKLVYDTLEYIVEEAHCPWYAEFRNTGLERSEVLAKDLEWFKEQGQAIPEPSTSALTYSQFLKELSRKDPHAFICHFYNIYVAHTSSGCMIGKKVAEIILDSRELEFYQWKGAIGLLLQNLREKLHKIANDWPSEEKTRCLEETMKSFKYSGEILRLISP
ncbi:hypothetical protein HPP92_024270 [Vanilla planifolia]|nr:hypothetical protein HPP92_024270 [Vanilla planifolia]